MPPNRTSGGRGVGWPADSRTGDAGYTHCARKHAARTDNDCDACPAAADCGKDT